MKKILLLFVALLCAQLSSAQYKFPNHVTADEYKSLSDTEKRLVDYINGAESALRALKVNGSKAYDGYAATLSLNLKGDKLSNFIAVGTAEPNANRQSCIICGLGSGVQCFRRIYETLQNGQTLVVTVVLVEGGDCAKVTWD